MLNLAANHLNPQALATLEGVADNARKTSLQQACAVLAGPTGETNSLTWHAPKVVTMTQGELDKAAQVLAVLAANGTKAQVAPSHALASWADKLGEILEVVEQEALDKNSIIIALEPLSVDEQVRLASLDGAIRRVIDATNGFDMARLYHEVSQSYNTTAAGGNASLMASA